MGNSSAEKLVLKNRKGQVARVFDWPASQPEVVVIRRIDSRRLEVVSSTESLTRAKKPFRELGRLTRDSVRIEPFALPDQRTTLQLVPVNDSALVVQNEELERYDRRLWILSFAIVILLGIAFVSFVWNQPQKSAAIEEELKQQVVQIAKNIKLRPQAKIQVQNRAVTETPQPTTKATQKTTAIRRMGALGVLGSLNASPQKGGLNLGAATTSAGTGLGGSAGSGGVQSSIYAKGLVAAPLGAGGNLSGGGGYGTKGKGGGTAGYGKMALVGSLGGASIPLGREAIVGAGIDRDAIADVINKNSGQVRFCYEQGLQGEPTLAGRVAVDFTIGGNGQVRIASVANTSLNSRIVEDCIVMRLKTWKFPLPEGGVDVKVSFPFVLRRSGQG